MVKCSFVNQQAEENWEGDWPDPKIRIPTTKRMTMKKTTKTNKNQVRISFIIEEDSLGYLKKTFGFVLKMRFFQISISKRNLHQNKGFFTVSFNIVSHMTIFPCRLIIGCVCVHFMEQWKLRRSFSLSTIAFHFKTNHISNPYYGIFLLPNIYIYISTQRIYFYHP